MNNTLLLGKHTKSPLTNTLVIGSAGSGKDYHFISPNILSSECSLVVFEPFKTVAEQRMQELSQKDYNVKCLDLYEFAEDTAHFNPFKRMFTPDNELDLLKVTEISDYLLANMKKDSFFYGAEIRILTAMIKHCYENKSSDGDMTIDDLHIFIDKLNKSINENTEVDGISMNIFKDIISDMPENTKKEIILLISVHISQYFHPTVSAILNSDDFDFTELRSKKTAYFITFAASDLTFWPLLPIFYKQMIAALYNPANSNDQDVHIIMNEFCNIPIIQDFPSLLAISPNYRIYHSVIVQAISQIHYRYKDKDVFKALIDGVETILYMMGYQEHETNEFIEKIAGSMNAKYILPNGKEKITKSPITQNEIYNFSCDNCIIINKGKSLIIDQKAC